MPAKNKSKINLLPKEAFSDTVAGRVLLWILTTFRILVIVTEIIVMIAFLSRFWLDAQNTDLNDEIELKKSLLSASLPFEQNFKSSQNKLLIASNLLQNQFAYSSLLENITHNLTSDTYLETINITGGEIRMDGVSTGERGIQQFLANLDVNDAFQEIALTDLKQDPGTGTLLFKIVVRM